MGAKGMHKQASFSYVNVGATSRPQEWSASKNDEAAAAFCSLLGNTLVLKYR
jgi:hypothetical protein